MTSVVPGTVASPTVEARCDRPPALSATLRTTVSKSPTILDTYANTSSAGSIIAFHLHNSDLAEGDTGLICSFGAGYSAGCVFVRKAA